jgi:hypothetical protein
MTSEQEEIQKTLDEMNQRVSQFQVGGNTSSYSESSSGSDFFSNPKIKLILVAIGVVILIGASVYFAVKSSGSKQQPIDKAILERMKLNPL